MRIKDMKQANRVRLLKRITIWITAFVMALSPSLALFSIAFDSYAETNEINYTENFDSVAAGSLATAGWNKGDSITIQDGAAILDDSVKGMYLSGNTQAKDWTNYTYSVDVTMTDTELSSTGNLAVAAIVVGANASNKGYEFGLCYNKPTDEYYVRLYDRAKASGKNSLGSQTVAFELNKAQNMKVEINDKTMTCFLNGVSVLTYTFTYTPTGTIGFITSNNVSKFDNIVVKNTEIVPEAPKVISYNQNFDSATNAKLKEEGWDKGENVLLENGVAVLNDSVKAMYMSKNEDSLEWTNYTYSADVTMTDTELSSTGNLAVAAIVVGANSSNKGYEFGLCYNKPTDEYYVRLYDRAKASGKNSLGSQTVAFELNKAQKMKVEINDKTMTCFLNGVSVLTYTFTYEPTGTIGFITNNNLSKFDNITVAETKATAGGEITIPYTENFETSTGEQLKQAGWNNGKNLTIQAGKAVLDDTVKSMYLSGNEKTLEWTNYVFKADVTLTNTELSSTGNLAVAAIVVGANSSNKGYEFGLCYNKPTDEYYVRLYDRAKASGKNLLGEADCDYQLNSVASMSVSIYGQKMICYFNSEKVFTYTFEYDLAGTIGLLTNSNVSYFDNLSVTESQEEVVSDVIDFYEKFDGTSNDLKLHGWDNWSKLTIKDEQAVLDDKVGYTYLSNKDESHNWEKYAYSADVILTDELVSPDNTGSIAFASIVVAGQDSKSGYEYGLCYNKNTSTMYLRLYDRANLKPIDQLTVDVALNQKVNMKVELGEENIFCYLNDELVMICSVEETPKGSIGIRTAVFKSIYDNIRVYDCELDEGIPSDASPNFTENFDDNAAMLSLRGWGNANKLTLDNGRALLTRTLMDMYLTNRKYADTWSDYSYSADVMMTDIETYDNSTKVLSLVIAADENKKGYEFGLCYNSATEKYYVRLYDRKNAVQIGKDVVCDYTINTEANMKAVIYQGCLYCYLDGELLIQEVLPAERLIGTIGIKAIGTDAYYDNLVVTLANEITEDMYLNNLIPDVRNNEVWIYEDFSKFDSMTDRGWSNECNLIREKMILDSANSNVYLDGIEKASEWSDYAVQTEVCMLRGEQAVKNLTSFAALVVRSSGAKEGYEFSMIVNNKTGVGGYRLYDRKTGTLLAETDQVVSECNETATLKVAVKGNSIKCFVDNAIVFDVIDSNNSNPVGGVGLRSSGYSSRYDDIIVYESNYMSPQTGDVTNVHQLAALFGLSLIWTGFVVFNIKFFKTKRDEVCVH